MMWANIETLYSTDHKSWSSVLSTKTEIEKNRNQLFHSTEQRLTQNISMKSAEVFMSARVLPSH